MPREDGQPLARPSVPEGVELRSGSDHRSTAASSRGGESVQQTNPKGYPGARWPGQFFGASVLVVLRRQSKGRTQLRLLIVD